ncbi:MAG TPA: hypothetical protein VME63_03230 [Dyella sp.]|uniref:hypothetical protein n=1 Tax=Dyella sp. TaxID=1869338 RepID=UPI002BC0B173|nr:hypothetical protein [Dyella sp.]HTV84388.1 hypothetical protein [Dyella sp.]
MKTKQVHGTLQQCVQMIMDKSLNQRRLYYLNLSQKAPYSPTTQMLDNHEVDLFGHAATCVGIASFATDQTYKKPLVSDSFGPCVPVIAIGRTGTHLAHCNGSGGIMDYSKSWLKTHRIMVVAKTEHAKQFQVANAIQELLRSQGFEQPELFKVPFSTAMGIIVIGSTVLAYPQV